MRNGGIKNPSYWIFFVLVFAIGFFIAELPRYYSEIEIPLNDISDNEVSSPSDWIKEDQVRITSEEVRIKIGNVTWAKFTDTNSMDPVIDNGMNSLEVKPSSESDIVVGDIISYHARFAEGIVVHRVVDIKEDENGIYYVCKGDNNGAVDPQKVRFSDVHGVVIGILF